MQTPQYGRLLVAIVAAACGALWLGHATAQSYPSKPIRWVIASTPGSAFDGLTRSFAAALGNQLGQAVYVDNIGGASGLLGMATVSRAPSDGYHLLTAGSSQLVFNPFFFKTMPYDPVKDYDHVTLVGDLPIALWVNGTVPVRNFAELVEYTKAHPGKLNYGSGGVGHILHLGMVMLEDKAALKATHIPYKGVGLALQDFLAGRLDLLLGVAQAPLLANRKAGKSMPVAGTRQARLAKLPDVPTLAELGVMAPDIPNWVGFVVRKGTPRDIVQKLHAETLRAAETDFVIRTLDGLGMERLTSTPAQFEARVRQDLAEWGPLIRKLGIQPE